MKLIQTVDAEGTVLCHDITQIIKGVTRMRYSVRAMWSPGKTYRSS